MIYDETRFMVLIENLQESSKIGWILMEFGV